MTYFKKSTRFGFRPTWREIHHAYWGLGLMLIGFIMSYTSELFGWSAVIIGLWWFLDDMVQHTYHRYEYRTKGYYEMYSFWHWFPYYLKRKIS